MTVPFYVTIKPETFQESNMSWLDALTKPGERKLVIGIVGDKFLFTTDNGEFFELYPRKCTFAGWA